jgi:hypothetical protein
MTETIKNQGRILASPRRSIFDIASDTPIYPTASLRHRTPASRRMALPIALLEYANMSTLFIQE